ncbi:peptide/nickel transport system substrate-binding protein [Nocardioides zeae]|uniref:Peptide/nickel transport system substrate-binding protein n=1 Tax=Nocardioides zeae TaxID=1457234 RepID=A0ACC6IE99_9ACTN|nr:ABC transporter substrate-binding protein [Nocardioides zeae]MDR6174182.1 peptide/nickel transport system substrate-binding protein [Nocardioides zeae]MDR6208989.1 peptide/nickel transport system substrate-binding protein [Nocardioides zeae]
MTAAPAPPARRRRPWVVGAAVAVSASLVTTACSAPPTSGSDSGDGLVIGRAMDLTSLDISRNLCDTCQIYNSAVYETLLQAPNATDDLEPLLAESWEANADNTQFTFVLDPDATFADGSPVEAKDVKWSWDRLKNLQGSPAYFMDGISTVEAPDAQTVVVTSEAPNSAFLNITTASYMGIINSDVASENGATADADAATTDQAENWFLSHSAGSGQYVLDSYAEGSQLVLARNDEYWGDEPAFPQVTIKEITDPAAQLQQLQQGDIDIAMNLSFDALDQVADDENLTVSAESTFNFIYVALSPGAPGGEALEDVRVREAIRKGIDYEAVIDATLAGNGERQASPIPNGFVGTEDLPLPEFDPEGAKQLLAEAGYADGLTLDVDFPTFFTYGVSSSTMLQAMQQSLSTIGVELNLNPIEFAQWVDQISTTGFAFTAVYFAPDHPDPVQYAQYFSLADGSVWSARAGVAVRPEETELLATALSTSGAEREAAYAGLAEQMVDDQIILPIVNPKTLLASSADVEGNNLHITRNLDLSALSFKD